MQFKNNKIKKILSSLLSITIIIFVVLFDFFTIYLNTNIATAATIGPVNPSAAVNNNSIGTVNWSSPTNVFTSNNSRSTRSLSRGQISRYLVARGFNFSAIPDGSTILGITVDVERSESGASAASGITDYAVRIVKGGAISAVQNKANLVTMWPSTAAEQPYVSYGGITDLWGESWTSADVKNANFGVAISAINVRISGTTGNEVAQIDHIRMTITYTAPTPLTAQNHFRWRNDDGTEATATWKAIEDSNTIGNVNRNTPIRLRMKAQNVGTGTQTAQKRYELQYGLKSSTCSAITAGSWVGVGNTSDAFDMASSQLVEGASITTQRLTSATTFVNGEARETADTTGLLGLLSAGAGTEIEYSFQATNLAVGDSTYCFRLYDTNNNVALDQYSVYPEVTVPVAYSLEQVAYRWRNDNGGESISPATFKAEENTAIIDQAKSENVRLRFLIKNSGLDTSGALNYRLQFATMVGGSCTGGDETFASVPAQSGCGSSEVCMTNSGNITDQASSANIASGLTDPSGSFVAGKLVTNPSNQATTVTLNNNEFTELEYNFQFTTNAVDGGNYCFRVDKSGSDLNTYTSIARATIIDIPSYALSGTYISSEYNISSAGIFNVIEWVESTTNQSCLSCIIKLQIKTAPDNGGTPGTWSATWSGPQGEDGDETDFFTVNTGELIHTDHNNDQWIQYKATLEGDGVDTPILENVRVNYKTL